jgi:hypothetical protein
LKWKEYKEDKNKKVKEIIEEGGLEKFSKEDEILGKAVGFSKENLVNLFKDAKNIKLQPIGLVIEYRTQWKLIQISYCYIGNIDENELYNKPLEEGSRLVWAKTPIHALELVQSYDVDSYDKRFMRMRDTAILEHYKSISSSV